MADTAGRAGAQGAEWELFRTALGTLWDRVEMEIESGEPELFWTDGRLELDDQVAGRRYALGQRL